MKQKSEIAHILGVSISTLHRWCIRFKFWEKGDRRKLIPSKEAKDIIAHFGKAHD